MLKNENGFLFLFFFFSKVSVSKQVVKVRLLKKSSSLDLDDPAVMEDILKQVNLSNFIH